MANISDDSVTLRALEPSDATLLYIWENEPEEWRHGDRRAPLSLAQLRDYVENYDADPFRAGQLRLMITAGEGEETVGAVDLFEIDVVNGRASVGILVAKGYRRCGYGARALRLLSDYAMRHLGLHQLWCICAASNEASRRLFEAAGFSISGRLRSWLRSANRYEDAYLYQKLLVREEAF